MNLAQLLETMTPEHYQALTQVVETGRWQNGIKLTQAQKDHCMQAIMLYQSRHNQEAQHLSIGLDGEIVFKSKAQLKAEFCNPLASQSSFVHQTDIMRVKLESE